jgi:coenzyme F420-reducing hydrogenase gamma subunit
MKRILVLMMILGMVLGSTVAADAAKKKKKPRKVERQVTGTYQSTGVVAVGTCAQTDAVNCVRIPAAANEQYVSAVVNDGSGQAVPVSVKADLDGDNRTETLYGVFCGETAEPIKIDPGVEVTFWVGITSDNAAQGCPPPTSGSIDVTFSNLP